MIRIKYFSIRQASNPKFSDAIDWRFFDFISGDIFAILTFDKNNNLVKNEALPNNIIEVDGNGKVVTKQSMYNQFIDNIKLIENGYFHRNLKADANYDPIYEIKDSQIYLIGSVDNIYSFATEEDRMKIIKSLYRDRKINSML